MVITIDQATWNTLRLYQDSIKYLKTKDIRKYKKAIDKETKIYKDVIKYLNESDH